MFWDFSKWQMLKGKCITIANFVWEVTDIKSLEDKSLEDK